MALETDERPSSAGLKEKRKPSPKLKGRSTDEDGGEYSNTTAAELRQLLAARDRENAELRHQLEVAQEKQRDLHRSGARRLMEARETP